MVYFLARPLARFVLRYYYRHLDVSGLENIPAKGAVIFAANHPTAFIEPCILACFQPRSLHFLARGDLFKNRFFSFLLGLVRILPVYRIQDGGYSKLKDNYATFKACFSTLSKQQAIMILAEGRCIHEKRLRPLRKGTGRIALGAMVNDPKLKEVHIIPVGVHFNQAENVRGQVHVEFGEPMLASKFLPTYQQQENKGVNELTEALRQRLEQLVVQVPSQEQDALAEAAFELDRTEHKEQLRYGLSHNGQQFARVRSIAFALPQVEQSPATLSYFLRLQQFGLQDGAVAGLYKGDRKLGLSGWLQALLASLLLLFWWPIWWLAESIAGTVIRQIEFYSPIRFGVCALLLIFYPLLWFLTAFLCWNCGLWGYGMLAYALLSLVTVRWQIRQWERVGRWYADRRAWRLIPQERTFMQQARKAALKEMGMTKR